MFKKQILIALGLLVVAAMPEAFAVTTGVLPPDIGASFSDIRADILTIGGGVILVALTIFGIRSVRSAAH